MNNLEYRPRFSFEISEEQKQRANKLLVGHGLRKALFTIILDDVLDLIEDHGGVAIGVIMSHTSKPHELLPSLNSAKVAAEKIGG